MSTWWAKFVAILRGEEPEAVASSIPVDVSGTNPDASSPNPPSILSTQSSNADFGGEQASPGPETDPRDMDAYIASEQDDAPAERVEADDNLSGLPIQVDEVKTAIQLVQDSLSEIARETKATSAEAMRWQETAAAMEGKIDAVTVQNQGHRETSEKLFEVVIAQVEAISNIEQRISVFDDRTAATYDEVSRTTRELDDLKSHLAQLSQAVAQSGEVCSDLADRQQQMAESLGSLEKQVGASCEAAKAASTAIQHLANDRVARIEGLRKLITAQGTQLAKRGAFTLALSGIAAAAAIAAAVLAYLR